MQFTVPDFEPVMIAIDVIGYVGAFVVAFLAGYIVGGIVQRG